MIFSFEGVLFNLYLIVKKISLNFHDASKKERLSFTGILYKI